MGYDPIVGCDAECAAANHCRLGGIQCDRCGHYNCACEMSDADGDRLCARCYGIWKDKKEE